MYGEAAGPIHSKLLESRWYTRELYRLSWNNLVRVTFVQKLIVRLVKLYGHDRRGGSQDMKESSQEAGGVEIMSHDRKLLVVCVVLADGREP
jgi:hypothetical protein